MTVVRVVDGDTIELEGGERLRYIGIDTPETVDPRKEVQCFGKEASAKNKELVEGQAVRLEKDVSETDRFQAGAQGGAVADGAALLLSVTLRDWCRRPPAAAATAL